ncbi:hypothetical protein RUM44_005746 [Polyplax serrata]|uniref:LRRCT domain-containing protein n=1 Tax=Polyplax serrata TaxID=468196 RepID=A0ABR1AX30_POLSC
MRLPTVIFVAFLAFASNSAADKTDKCRIVQKTTMTCVKAGPEDFPKVKNDKIEWLLISKSNVPTITKDQMQHYPSLTDLHGEKNGIEKIDEDAFSMSKNLDWVDLSFNKLTVIDPNIFKNCPKIQYFNISGNSDLVVPEHAPFLKAPSLQWLLLQQSNIKEVYLETFKEVPGLKVLSLSDNSLKTLPLGVFQHLTNLYSLDLSKNQFSVLPVSLFQPLQYISLYLSDNPWNCDCELNPTIQWAKNRRLKDEVRCSKPDNKKWQEIINMKCASEVSVF